MNPWGGNTLWALVVLALDIWAIINIVQSGADNGKKVLWILLVLILPVVGFILWLVMGPRGNKPGV